MDLGKELQERSCKVVVVARATRDSGLKWMDTEGFSNTLVLDPSLNLYRHFGLKRSVQGVWSVATLCSYARDRVAKVTPSPSYEGDDLHVMGGDFITDTNGKLVYAYPSKYSYDRPSVQQILAALDNIKRAP